MQVYVNVYLYRGLINDVVIFRTEEEADEDFMGQIGMSSKELKKVENEYHDMQGSGIFILDLKAVRKEQKELIIKYVRPKPEPDYSELPEPYGDCAARIFYLKEIAQVLRKGDIIKEITYKETT